MKRAGRNGSMRPDEVGVRGHGSVLEWRLFRVLDAPARDFEARSTGSSSSPAAHCRWPAFIDQECGEMEDRKYAQNPGTDPENSAVAPAAGLSGSCGNCTAQGDSRTVSPSCRGNCTIQEFEVRNRSYDDAALDPRDQPGCRPSPPFGDGQKAVFDSIDGATKPASAGCLTDCQCAKIANQAPPWTEWAKATIELTYAQSGCSWKLRGSYEFRTRQFQGLCGPLRTVATAAFIPELGLTITGRTPVSGDQLVAIGQLLKTPIRGELFTPAVEFSLTRIGEVFGPGRVETAAYLDSRKQVAYVAEHQLDRVRIRLGAEIDGSSLIVRSKCGPRAYAIESLDALDDSQPINEGDRTVLDGWTCSPFSPGQCINVVNVDTQAFLFSFTAPASGVSICRRQKDDQCAVMWRQLTVQAFADPDCRGAQVVRTVNFALCSPE
jgi:hypothetical protein